MKKIILFIFLIFLTTQQADAVCNYYSLCPQPQNQRLSSGVSRFVSRATGTTFFAEQIGKSIIRNELRKATGANFDVDLKTFGLADLLNGTFKYLEVKGNNIVIEKNYFSRISLQTVCDYNSIDYNARPVKFRENLIMNFSVEMTDQDIKNTLSHGGFLNDVNKINLSGFGITFFKVDNSSVDIKDGKIYFTIHVRALGIPRPFDVVVSADLLARNGQIVKSQIDLVNLFTAFNLGDYTYLLNKTDPLTFGANILENKNSEINIQKFEIIGDRIFVNGTAFLPKN